jgi:sugar phosphate isomerase/epimerase
MRAIRSNNSQWSRRRNNDTAGARTRREFIRDVAAYGTAALAAGALRDIVAAQNNGWQNRVGLELYTVRDLMATDFEGVLAKVAAIGYTEIEPANGYNNMPPAKFRAMLDRLGLAMPSTHSGATGTGLELEKQLEGFQVMGIKYTEISAGAPAAARGGAARPAAPLPPGAYFNPGTGVVHNAFTGAEAFGPYQPPDALETVKRRAAQLNANGRIAQKFGMKVLVHNHTGEFEKLTDSPRTTYDVLLAETDPSLVTMQLDIGWTYIAGVDPLSLFKSHPGRFELWHLKDVFGLKTVNPSLGPNARTSSMAFAPVGAGQIDFKTVFANASLAGLRHFAVEHDNAAAWGDSLAAARVSYRNLARILS